MVKLVETLSIEKIRPRPPQTGETLAMPLLRMIVSAVIAFGFDRFSKVLIIYWLDLPSVHVIYVWPPYLNLVMAWNPGANFGLLGESVSRWVFVAFAVVLSLVLAIWARNKRGWLLPLAIGAVIGGALGNAFDRIIYGAVMDYLNMSCCGITNPYAFNVADVLIFGGLAFIAIGQETKHNQLL